MSSQRFGVALSDNCEFGMCLLKDVPHLTDQALPIYWDFGQTSGFLKKRARLHPHFQVIRLLFAGIGAVKPLKILAGNSNSLSSYKTHQSQ